MWVVCWLLIICCCVIWGATDGGMKCRPLGLRNYVVCSQRAPTVNPGPLELFPFIIRFSKVAPHPVHSTTYEHMDFVVMDSFGRIICSRPCTKDIVMPHNGSHVHLGRTKGMYRVALANCQATFLFPGSYADHDFQYDQKSRKVVFIRSNVMYASDVAPGKASKPRSLLALADPKQTQGDGHAPLFKGREPHMNSIFWEYGADTLWLSARFTNSVYLYDLKKRRIRTRIGPGSNIPQRMNGRAVPSIFQELHAIQKIGPGRFLVFDNNNYKGATQSFVKEYTFDGQRANVTNMCGIPQTSWGGLALPTYDGGYMATSSKDGIITAMSRDYKIRWRLKFGSKSGGFVTFYRSQYMLAQPYVTASIGVNCGTIDLVVKDLFLRHLPTTAQVKVGRSQKGKASSSSSVPILAFMQRSPARVSLPNDVRSQKEFFVSVSIDNRSTMLQCSCKLCRALYAS
eukprot:NODE_1570_length_1680_cov_79.926782_g1492_i0.p1 GENE.NODE_1570_length_1680_cov_79.926782_g1492_i0~~NODE_1570_length_1680_cov_79.926782_g1492_i0.p1  ORF type:complete len:456 (-),score=47.06 NODE_1570_length_1680_cov_79.926782_g1492_i0:197-1564(-)